MYKNSFSLSHKIINLTVGFFLLISIISCKKVNIEFQLISSTICTPPCWQNIIPGKTNKQETVTLLKDIQFIDSKSIVVKGESWNSFNDVVLFKIPSHSLNGEIYFVNDIVVFIGIFGNLNIKFSKAIEELGDPEYIINIPMYNPDKSYEIFALIPDKGIDYAFNTEDKGIRSNSEILPENNITRLDFFDPSFFDYLLDAGTFSEGYLNSVQTKEYMITWSGYGEIDQKYPPAKIETK